MGNLNATEGVLGEASPRTGVVEIRTLKVLLTLAINFQAIAFRHLCRGKENWHIQVYQKFLETYVTNWSIEKQSEGSILLQDVTISHISSVLNV